MGTDRPIAIHVMADSTGDTAARVARATRVQYEDFDTRIVRHPRIRTASVLRAAFEDIVDSDENVVIFSTLVDDAVRGLLNDLCAEHKISHVDLLLPAMQAMERATGAAPSREIRQVDMDADYFRKIQAMEFAIALDDGQRPESLPEADIVLIGVSRTGKTPLSMYLGYLGYKTANIPLVARVRPPEQLFEVDPWHVVGLSIDPERLLHIRQRRLQTMGASGRTTGYSQLAAIYGELEYAETIQKRLGCPVVDTTELALEEAAVRVIELVENRRRALTGH